jgi:kynurenine formamidase
MLGKKRIILVLALALVLSATSLSFAAFKAVSQSDVTDLTCLVSHDYPCWWPTHPEYLSIPYHVIGPAPWRSNLTIIDEHVGTHYDAPAHFIPRAETGLPAASVFGEITNEKVPVWQLGGEACVIDVSNILDQAPNGQSPIITKDMVQAWESKNRSLGPSDVVLFRGMYDDKYYKPFPEGRRFLADGFEGKSPLFPAPNAECVSYVASKGVMTIAIDSPSMGPFPGAVETHHAVLGKGVIYLESLINCGSLPPTGSFIIFLPPKFEGASGAPGRAIAITEKSLAAELIKAVKDNKVADLSVMDGPGWPDYWPGSGVGNNTFPHLVAPYANYVNWRGPYYTNTHVIDAHTGTHFDPPTHFLPNPGFDNSKYGDWTKGVLEDYEKKYGKRGESDVYAADYPVHQMMGPARVVDVSYLCGTTDPSKLPWSPVITVEDVQKHEKLYGPIQAGEVVLFKSGWTDRNYVKEPEPNLVAAALNGKVEGWPSPSAETMLYLAKKGVKCVGTDGASLGAVTGKEAVQTHWAGLTQGMCYPEVLTNLGALPPTGAFFIFLPLKEEKVPGGIGRAVALIP